MSGFGSLCLSCSQPAGVIEIFPPPSCHAYADYLHVAGLFRTAGTAMGVALQGRLAVVASGRDGLILIDFTDPVAPVARGAVDTTGSAYAVSLRGDIAVVAWGTVGVVVVDIADHDAPRIVGAVDTPGKAVGVAVSDSFAFVADDVIGMIVVDIGDPFAPRIRGIENTPGKPSGVAVVFPNVYVSDEALGLRIIDARVPDSPWLVKAISLPDAARGVSVSGGHAFVADGAAGLVVVDVRSAVDAQVVGELDTPGSALAIAVSQSVAVVADQSSGVAVIDVSDPLQPLLLNRLEATDVSLGVAFDPDVFVVADGDAGVRFVDARTPSPPEHTFFPGSGGGVTDARAVAICGQRLLVADHAVGLRIAAFGPGGTLSETAVVRIARGPIFVVCNGDTAFVCTDNDVTVMVDLARSMGPAVVGIVPGSDHAIRASVEAGTLYMLIAGGSGERLSSFTIDGGATNSGVINAGGASALAVYAGHAYVSTRSGDLLTVGTANLNFENRLAVGSAEDVVVQTDSPGPPASIFAYVSVRFGPEGAGVLVVSLSNPALPAVVGFVPTTVVPRALTLAGNRWFVSGGGVEIIDASDPQRLLRIGYLPLDSEGRGGAERAGVFYGAAGSSGVVTARGLVCD